MARPAVEGPFVGASVVGFADSLSTAESPLHGGHLRIPEQPRELEIRGTGVLPYSYVFAFLRHRSLPSLAAARGRKTEGFTSRLLSSDRDQFGKVDNVLIGYFASTQLGLFPNHRWQHDADRTIPPTGGLLTIDTFARAGFAIPGLAQTYVTIAPPTRPSVPGVFGFLAIDPTWAARNIIPLAVPSGTAQEVVPIPPLLPGLRFWMQSMLFDGTVVRASNITETVIQ